MIHQNQGYLKYFHRLFGVGLLLFKLLLFSACEDMFVSEVRNPNFPGGEPQLVVYSFISPQDTIIRVHVFRSMPYIYKDTIRPVGANASVRMARKGENFKQLVYNDEYGCFVISSGEFQVEAAKYYILDVQTPEGEKVSAECYVPEISSHTLSVDSVSNGYGQWGGEKFTVTWKLALNPANHENYYYSTAFTRRYMIDLDEVPPDTMLLKIDEFWIEKGDALVADSEGQAYSFRAYKWVEPYQALVQYPRPESYEIIDSTFIMLLQTDYHYYRFHKSVENYFYYDDDFPFAESVHIYTNILGGLGVFTGYNRKDIVGHVSTLQINPE